MSQQYQLSVFDDPSISSSTVSNIAKLATDANCSVDTGDNRVIQGAKYDIVLAQNLALRLGWKVSNVRLV
jgi:hypothetical protein